MKSGEPKRKRQLNEFIYDAQGTKDVSKQIMDAYNSGVIDREDGSFKWKDGQEVSDR